MIIKQYESLFVDAMKKKNVHVSVDFFFDLDY